MTRQRRNCVYRELTPEELAWMSGIMPRAAFATGPDELPELVQDARTASAFARLGKDSAPGRLPPNPGDPVSSRPNPAAIVADADRGRAPILPEDRFADDMFGELDSATAFDDPAAYISELERDAQAAHEAMQVALRELQAREDEVHRLRNQLWSMQIERDQARAERDKACGAVTHLEGEVSHLRRVAAGLRNG